MTERTTGIDTSHLGEEELVDALDGVLVQARAAHVERCAACAARVEELRGIACRAAGVEVPEPPPFFWSQFSARVRAAVDEEQQRARMAVRRPWVWPSLGAAAAIAAIVLVIALTTRPTTSVPDSGVTIAHPSDAGDVDDVLMAIDQDEAWAVLRVLAEDLDHEEMGGEGVAARPGSAERLTPGLSEPERVELVRLLEEQLKGRRLPESAS